MQIGRMLVRGDLIGMQLTCHALTGATARCPKAARTARAEVAANQHPTTMKKLFHPALQRVVLLTGTLALLATESRAAATPRITSPANGATITQTSVDVQVSVPGIEDVQSVKIRSNGTVIGSAAPTSYFGEWSFPDGSHISILEGSDGTAVKIDYTPPGSAPMFLIDGTMTGVNTCSCEFIHWPGGGVTKTGNVNATFTFTSAGLLNVAFVGDTPLGTRNVIGGLSRNETYHFVWNNPPAGTQSLTAVVTCLVSGTPCEVTSGAVAIKVVIPKAPEIVVQQPKGSGLADGSDKRSFGTVKIGKAGSAKTFTIKNTGTAGLTGLKITKTGSNAKDFSVTGPDKTTLAPGAGTTFKVTFKPKAKGNRNAVIHIKSNDADENPFDIKLTGLGKKP